MTNIEQLKTNQQEQYDTAMNSVRDLTKSAQTIAAAHKDYANQSFEQGLGYFERLVGLKSVDQLIELNTAHAKTAHELFLNESKRIGELYSDFAKQAFKPIEAFTGKFNQPTVQQVG